MNVEQIYTGCLAQGAYYITSNGEAAIIDPLRETQPYLDKLKDDGVQLKYIFETHFHADFVSGHLDLSKAAGASIVFGPTAETDFESIIAEDEQVFEIGNIKIKLMHTPGHTMESSTYLLIDAAGKDHAIFSGDTLFLGDVGRPDLAQKAASMTQEDLAGYLYDSLMTKIMPLGDDITVYPAHGAGSACGKNMMKETVDTLGNQKKVNYALNQPNKESFIEAVTDGLLPPPAYFGANVAMNKTGYQNVDDVIETGMTPLSPKAFEAAAEGSNALILDTRNDEEFKKGFIPNSINIGIEGGFAPWVGALIGDVKLPLLLITDKGREEEVLIRLSRVGFDNVLGFLEGGIEAWKKEDREMDNVKRMTAEEFQTQYKPGDTTLFDIRKPGEYQAEHIEEAFSRPLADINEWIKEINPDQTYYMHCLGGYRSMIAASILQSRGYRNFVDVIGGMDEMSKTSIPKSDFMCDSKVMK